MLPEKCKSNGHNSHYLYLNIYRCFNDCVFVVCSVSVLAYEEFNNFITLLTYQCYQYNIKTSKKKPNIMLIIYFVEFQAFLQNALLTTF